MLHCLCLWFLKSVGNTRQDSTFQADYRDSCFENQSGTEGFVTSNRMYGGTGDRCIDHQTRSDSGYSKQ
jgi:hypothetical protein